jgi:myosin-7
VIKKALRKMPAREFETTAVQCFKNITGFMGDRSTSKEDGGHAEKLLKNCLNSPEELRDEVYCQLIKQTTNNPNPDGLVKGWQLFGIMSGAFPPSKEFEPYLLSHFNDHINEPHGVGDYAKYCMGRLAKAGDLGPRQEIPVAMEIDACKARLPVILRVYHLDGTYEAMPIVSWTTARHMNEMMAVKLGIKDAEAFSVYEMTPDGEERYLEPNERLLDLVAYWQRLFEEEKSEKKDKTSITNMYRLVYKVHMYFDVEDSDTAARNEMYTQAVYDVVSSRYPCEPDDAVQLAALQWQVEHAEEEPNLAGRLSRYLPAKYTEVSTEAEYIEKIKAAHSEVNGLKQGDAKGKYLDLVKGWKIYGSSFFFVEPQMTAELPEEVFLAVNPKGILIINPDTKEILKDHPYNEVPTWGHSGSSFVLHVGNLIRQTKLFFHTEQGKDINDLVRAYVNHLCVA